MTIKALTQPATVNVNRSQLRQRQSSIFRKASGRTVVMVSNRGRGEEKYLVDKGYFDELLRKLKAAAETLEITSDPKLFPQILAAAGRLEQDLRSGRLYSLDEAFGEG